jgi:hypothetical protein
MPVPTLLGSLERASKVIGRTPLQWSSKSASSYESTADVQPVSVSLLEASFLWGLQCSILLINEQPF